jgi:lipoic acid synthetase
MAVRPAEKPPWLKVKLPSGENYRFVRSVIDENRLHTVCESAHCPNMGECWGAGTATLMLLGNICTRSCGFCAVLTGRPTELDWEEPERVARAVELMKLQHCVLTSVNRDELKDGGAEIWARTIRAIKTRCPGTTIEVLLPDFKGNWDALYRVLEEKPDVVSHNMETVPRLYRQVRPQAKYERSLEFIRRTKEAGFRTKSGAMLGIGETHEEILALMQDLLDHGCDVLTLGQYLQPTPQHLPVQRFVTPEEFEMYRQIGLEMGFDYVESGPLVRSSYHSERHVKPRRSS